MSHISLIGRKSWPARLAFLLMYAFLIIGGITMIVPFMVMVSSSFKSNVDSQKYDAIPAYWSNQRLLTLKYLEQKTNYELLVFWLVARSNVAKLDEYTLPTPANQAEVKDYYDFVKTLPATSTFLVDRGPQFGNPATYGTHPLIYQYRKELLAKYGKLSAIEKAYAMSLVDVEQLMPPFEKWYERGYLPEYTVRLDEYLKFKDALPVESKMPVPAESLWNQHLRVKFARIDDANKALGTDYSSIESAPLPLRQPVSPPSLIHGRRVWTRSAASSALAREWEEMVRNEMPIWYIRADESARPAWISFLRTRYLDNFSLYLKAHPETPYRDFAMISLPEEQALQDGVTIGEWSDFVNKALPSSAIRLYTPEQRYRDYLQETYGSLAAVNRRYGTSYTDWSSIYLPSMRVAVAEATQQAGAIRWAFATRNYQTVANYLVLHGRAFFNTAIYILLALLFTLTVNPITAYALSRFKLRATNKVLLFLLATMAFPAEIAMIPNFLILKELHLLNTYWALVLPGMANGFSIFLLKGMFDGLPQDLYEAAALDGAGEATIFWRVTMPLVKPFLAYLSLGTFVSAYSAFAFAFLLCPDPKMWTVMVFLQQMGSWASQPVKFAAFVLASIPTLIVFITCQRIIMQGIVLPTEK